jgi:hypothetical protein
MDLEDRRYGWSARPKAATYTEHKHRKETRIDIHVSSGIRAHDPSVSAFRAVDREATVTGYCATYNLKILLITTNL